MASGTSYNGWPANSDPNAIGVVQSLWFPGGVKSGDVTTVLRYVAEQFNARVEPIVGGWCWGFTYKANANNPSQLSCHASGTALDINAPDHPNGVGGTFTNTQRGQIYAILDEVQGGVDWLESYDEMHFEICVNANTLSQIAATLGSSQPTPPPPTENEDDDMMKLIAADTGNGAVFAYGNGRFFHVPDGDHLNVGGKAGLWDVNSILFVSQYELDVVRDNCCGNGQGKGDNLVNELPSDIAS